MQNASIVKYGEVDVSVPYLEYLMAIMIQTGRGKDKARIEELMLHKELFNQNSLESLIKKFNLTEKWDEI